MQTPLQVTFRHMAPSPFVESHIRERASALHRYFRRIMACRVVVEASTRRQRRGRIYHIRVDLTLPGREIIVKRDPPEHRAHEAILVAVRDAFDAARRQLEDHARQSRGDTKAHDAPPHGRIARLFKKEGYGIIRSSDGDEIYMHRNAVVSANFDALWEGDESATSSMRAKEKKGRKPAPLFPSASITSLHERRAGTSIS